MGYFLTGAKFRDAGPHRRERNFGSGSNLSVGELAELLQMLKDAFQVQLVSFWRVHLFTLQRPLQLLPGEQT